MYLGIFLVGTTPFDNASKETKNKMLQHNRENHEHLKYVRNVIPVQSHIQNPPAKCRVFTAVWATRTVFLLYNQMVNANPFGKPQKMWAVTSGDAIFLLFLVCSVDLDIPCSTKVVLPPRQSLRCYVYAQDFHTGGLCEWTGSMPTTTTTYPGLREKVHLPCSQK